MGENNFPPKYKLLRIDPHTPRKGPYSSQSQKLNNYKMSSLLSVYQGNAWENPSRLFRARNSAPKDSA